jgi:hypothetical protein
MNIMMNLRTLKDMFHFYYEVDMGNNKISVEEIDLMACQANENIEELEQFLNEFIGYIKEINE